MAKPVSNPYGMDSGFRYMDTAENAAPPGEESEREVAEAKRIRRTNTIVLFAVVFVLLVACAVFFLKIPT